MFEKFLKELNSELDKAGVSDKESIADEYIKRYNDLLAQNLSPFEIIVLFGDPADIARRFISPDYNRSAKQSLKNNSMLKKADNKKTQNNLLDMTSLDLHDVEIDDEHKNLSEYRNEKEIVNKNIENYKAFIYQLENEIEEIEDKIKILLDEIARRKKEKQAGITASENPITENDINLAMELEKELQKKQEQLMDFYKNRKYTNSASTVAKKTGLRNTDDFRKKAEENKKKILEQIPVSKANKQEKSENKKISKTQNKTTVSDRKTNIVSKTNDEILTEKKESENISKDDLPIKESINSSYEKNVYSFSEIDATDKSDNLKSNESEVAVASEKTEDNSNKKQPEAQVISNNEPNGTNSDTEKDPIFEKGKEANNESEQNQDTVKADTVKDIAEETENQNYSEKSGEDKKYTTVEYYDSETGENISNFLNIQFYRDPNSGKTHMPPEKGEAKQNVKRIKVVEEIDTAGSHKPEEVTGDGIEKVAHDLTSNSKQKSDQVSSQSKESDSEMDLKSDIDKLKTSLDNSDTEERKEEKSIDDLIDKSVNENSLSEKDKVSDYKSDLKEKNEIDIDSDFKSEKFFEKNGDEDKERDINEKSEKGTAKSEESVKEEVTEENAPLLSKQEESSIKNPFLEKEYTFVGGKKINIDFSEEKNVISENSENNTTENFNVINRQEISELKNTAVENEGNGLKQGAENNSGKTADTDSSANQNAVSDFNGALNENSAHISDSTENTSHDLKNASDQSEKTEDKIEEESIEKESIPSSVADKKEDILNGVNEDKENFIFENNAEIKESSDISKDEKINDNENIAQEKQDNIVKEGSLTAEKEQTGEKEVSLQETDQIQVENQKNNKLYKKGIDVIVKKADTKEDKSYIKDKARAIEKGIIEEHIDDLVFADTKMRGWRSVKTKIKRPKVIRKSEILPDKINIDEINMDIVEAEDTVRIVQCGNSPVQKQVSLQSPLMKTGTIANQIENKVQVSASSDVTDRKEVYEEPYAEHIPLSKVLYKRPEEGKILRRENLPFMITGIVFAVFMAALINLVTLFGGMFVIITSLSFLAGNFSSTVVVASQLNISIVLIFTGLLMIAGIGLCDVYVIKWIIESIRDCYEVVRLLNKNKEVQDEPLYEVIKIPTSTHEPRLFNVGNKKPIEVLKKPGGLSDDLIYNKDIKKSKTAAARNDGSSQNSENSLKDDKINKENITVENSAEDAGTQVQGATETENIAVENSANDAVSLNGKNNGGIETEKTDNIASDKNDTYSVLKEGVDEKVYSASSAVNDGNIDFQSENKIIAQENIKDVPSVNISGKIEEKNNIEDESGKPVDGAIPVKNSPKHKLEDYEFRRIMKERAEKVASMNTEPERGTSGDLADVYAGEKMLHSEAKERTDIIPSEEEKERIREELKKDFKQDALQKEIKSAKELRKAEKEEKKKAKLFKKMTEKASMPEKTQPNDKGGLKMEDTVIEGINVGANKNTENNSGSQMYTEDADTVFEKHMEKIEAISEKETVESNKIETQNNEKVNGMENENNTVSQSRENQNSSPENATDKKENVMKDLLFTDPDKKAASSDDMPKSGHKEIKDDPQNSRTQQLQKGESVPVVPLVTPEKSDSETSDNAKNKKDKDKNDKQGGGDININDWFF